MFTQCQQCKALFQVSDAQLATANGYVRCGQCLAIFSATDHESSDLLEENATIPFQQQLENGQVGEKTEHQHDWVDDQPLFDHQTPSAEYATTPLTQEQQTACDETAADRTISECLHSDSRPEPISVSVAPENIFPLAENNTDPEHARDDESKHSLETPDEGIKTNAHEANDASHCQEDVATLTAINFAPASEMTSTAIIATGYIAEAPLTVEAGATDSKPEALTFTTEKENPSFILEQMQAEQTARQHRSTIPYLLGSLLLMLALTTQFVYLSRDQLAANPQLHPWLTKACKLVGCTLAPTYDIGQIKIIGLEIFSHPETPSALLANTAIINKADFTQPYPLLMLIFTDISGTRLAQRRFLPEEYLPAHVRPETGMQPDTAIKLVLQLADPGKDAINFEFQLQSDPRHQLARRKLKNPLSDLLSRL